MDVKTYRQCHQSHCGLWRCFKLGIRRLLCRSRYKI